MEYVLRVKDLTKRYGNSQALSGLNMNVPKGAIYGFVGRNGAGKTTLIRLVCGLQSVTSGEYILYGAKNSDESKIRKARKRMGAVVETPAVYPDMTAKDNIKTQYRVLGMPDFKGVDELLALVGLADTGRKRVKDFSLGMRQRLGIAVALAGSPDLLILDEPANGLDPQGIIEMRELILDLNRRRRITVIISSHNLDELSRIATCYGFIDGGRMVKEISGRELREACRKCTVLTVDDTAGLARGLDMMGFEYDIISGREAKVYGEIPVSELSFILAKQNCRILSMKEEDETLESYYINLVGGGSYE